MKLIDKAFGVRINALRLLTRAARLLGFTKVHKFLAVRTLGALLFDAASTFDNSKLSVRELESILRKQGLCEEAVQAMVCFLFGPRELADVKSLFAAARAYPAQEKQ
jgi:hypothetical protein